MKNSLLYFRFRTWHFCLLLIGFSLFVFLAEPALSGKAPEKLLSHLYEEVADELEDIRLGFLLFTGNEPYSDRMEAELAYMAHRHGWDAQLFKMDVEEYSDLSAIYRISATPSIIVLQNGQECCRVSGIIPAGNLQHIYQRFTH
ncbi:MAG: thioredoxin family protein [Tannerellaceae bacterium]|nr:thioredoxin family protein [Tannerellaceae bacterium]